MMKIFATRSVFFGVFASLLFLSCSVHARVLIWANDGGDKVTRDELRAHASAAGVINRVWDGETVRVFGAKNEVVSFNLIIEAPTAPASNVAVSLDSLAGPDGAVIRSMAAAGDGVFNWVGRNIELFLIGYLEIRGLSTDIFYENGYDERHVPERMRRPWTGEGEA
ncbi:MAG: hypothetical protein GY859_08305, partial [Desulfobacterales bacterium]|nr:hypothetical protein [Desulfobacterales bacterium]